LSPRAWRQYGEEFLAFLEQVELGPAAVADVAGMRSRCTRARIGVRCVSAPRWLSRPPSRWSRSGQARGQHLVGSGHPRRRARPAAL